MRRRFGTLATSNHMHLVVEASHREALRHHLQGLAVRLARAINKLLGRKGNVLRYVLLNARHHAAERGTKLSRYWVDPFSSAPWFDGWRDRVRSDAPWLARLRNRPRPTATARTWLLATGWRKHGLLAFDEVPGSAPATDHA